MQVEMIVYCVERVCHCKQSKLIHFFYPQNSISSMAVKNDARRMAIKEVNLFICTKIIETTLMHKVECSRNFLCEKISFKKLFYKQLPRKSTLDEDGSKFFLLSIFWPNRWWCFAYLGLRLLNGRKRDTKGTKMVSLQGQCRVEDWRSSTDENVQLEDFGRLRAIVSSIKKHAWSSIKKQNRHL